MAAGFIYVTFPSLSNEITPSVKCFKIESVWTFCLFALISLRCSSVIASSTFSFSILIFSLFLLLFALFNILDIGLIILLFVVIDITIHVIAITPIAITTVYLMISILIFVFCKILIKITPIDNVNIVLIMKKVKINL